MSGIRDNHHRGTVGEFLESKIQNGSSLSIVSAYFTIYAFDALKESLNGIDELRFLFGEPRFVKSLDPEKMDKKAFKIEDEGLQLQNRLEQKRAAQECAEWIKKKVQIRSIRAQNLLHGKMYHIAHNGVEKAIMGSSNFTVRGLGLSQTSSNIELNLEVDSDRDRRDLKVWFDELWDNKELVEDVKADVLSYLEQLYQNHAPEFIYYKTLFHIFEQYLGEQEDSELFTEQKQLFDKEIWNALFEFQKDGVKGAINKIRRHNGCIIADSVGLGKTFEALAVIKYFELENDRNRVLVLCPRKLRDNWTIYQTQNNSDLNPFRNDHFRYTVLSHTDLSRNSGKSGDIDLATINWGDFDLVVIDESHNFRNNTRNRRDEDGNLISKSRYQRLMEDIIQSGVKTKVLLLSATPVNNDLKDLRNQIYFFTEDRDDAFRESLGIVSLKETLTTAQRRFNEWAKQSDENRQTSALLEQLSSAFFKLLDELTIARSRKHIEKYYQDSLKDLGGFPTRSKPISVSPNIDLKKQFMSYDKLNDEISNYQLSLFNPSKYVLPEYQSQYDTQQIRNFTQSDREHYLIGMMKVNFLKRLESSVHSFAITMRRTIEKIEALEERIKRFQAFRDDNPDLDLEEMEIEALEDEELQEAMQVGKKLIFKMAHLNVDKWLEDLKQDHDQLSRLYHSAIKITPDRDAKLAELKKLIAEKVKHPTIAKNDQPNCKVLVFTHFADTATYLYDTLRQWVTEELEIHIAMVSGGSENKATFGRNEFSHILTNFSPVAKKRDKMKSMPQDGEIDLLIGTDCISEGQNLQDCDYLINYDIHWNPVRIIQRFGRIDRIGSINHSVQLVNFWPTSDLDRYINVENRVKARMALVDIAATQEDNLLKPEDIQDVIDDDLKYRDKQLLRLQKEVLDLEDFNESIALNEFTLDDFRIGLMKYIESNRQILEDAPFGLYAVVPPKPGSVIYNGVVFCLRQKGDSTENEKLNPLQPYFLVYIREDGEVRFTFAQPKQILDMYRQLCENAKNPYEKLCALFDKQTHNGANMTQYNDLLEKAVRSLSRTYQKRAIGNLLSDRSGTLPKKQQHVSKTTDFELITWLVIKSENQ